MIPITQTKLLYHRKKERHKVDATTQFVKDSYSKNNHNSFIAVNKSEDEIALIPKVSAEAKLNSQKNPVTIHNPIPHNCECSLINGSEKVLCLHYLGIEDDIQFFDKLNVSNDV